MTSVYEIRDKKIGTKDGLDENKNVLGGDDDYGGCNGGVRCSEWR